MWSILEQDRTNFLTLQLLLLHQPGSFLDFDLTWPGPAQYTQHKLSHFAVSSSPPALAVSWKLSSLDFDLTSTGQPQTNFLTLRLLLHQLGSSSAPNNAQLWVYYAQISILMHRLVIHATSWCTHTFEVIEIADGHLVHQQKPDWQSSERKTLLAWPHSCLQCWLLKCHFWQLYFKADWSKIHFLSMPLFLLWLKTCCFYLVYTCKEVLSSMYHTVLNDCKCEDSKDCMFVFVCVCVFQYKNGCYWIFI